MQYPELIVDYQPRDQFLGFHDRLERFACIVTHRRAGKTVACIHDLQGAAMACERIRPRLAYLSPFLKQSKAVAWDYLRSAMAPLRAIGASVHESELRVDYPNGGQVRLYGADNPDGLRGIYLDGVVLDEYADMDPRVWSEIIRPALADRAGWAVFIGTPKGRNAFFELWRRAQSEANWFSLMLKASDTSLIPASELALAKRDLSEEQYAQEFECSFEAAVVGAYFGKLMARAEAERRIAAAPYDPAAPVWTSWDLGVRDATAIWFAHVISRGSALSTTTGLHVDLGHTSASSARACPGTSCRWRHGSTGSCQPRRHIWPTSRCCEAARGSGGNRSGTAPNSIRALLRPRLRAAGGGWRAPSEKAARMRPRQSGRAPSAAPVATAPVVGFEFLPLKPAALVLGLLPAPRRSFLLATHPSFAGFPPCATRALLPRCHCATPHRVATWARSRGSPGNARAS
jgi:hypothetical protein